MYFCMLFPEDQTPRHLTYCMPYCPLETRSDPRHPWLCLPAETLLLQPVAFHWISEGLCPLGVRLQMHSLQSSVPDHPSDGMVLAAYLTRMNCTGNDDLTKQRPDCRSRSQRKTAEVDTGAARLLSQNGPCSSTVNTRLFTVGTVILAWRSVPRRSFRHRYKPRASNGHISLTEVI
jgi:hypothetical protein